jgi:hypothetical protein
MVWAYIKSYVPERNTTFKMKDVQLLFNEAVAAVTPELWAKYVDHAKKTMDSDWQNEGLDDQSVRSFAINLCPGDFESDTGSESSSEDDL